MSELDQLKDLKCIYYNSDNMYVYFSTRVHSHEIAEAAGLISQAFGTEEVDRHIVLFKKVCRTHMSETV